MKRTFNLILTLALWLVAQTAWADDVTWYMDGGKNGHSTCTFNANEKTAEVTSDQHSKTLRYTWTSGDGLRWIVNQAQNGLAKFDHPITNGCVVTFPDIIGTVTGMTITYLQFFNNAGCTMKMYVGQRGTTPTLLTTGGSDYLVAHSSSTAFDATFTGSIDVDADHPLAIWFEGQEETGEFTFGFTAKNNIIPTIQVAYTPAATIDHGHSFSITTSGNVLTATCTNNEQSHQCIPNHQATLTLNAEDGMASIINPVSASITPSLSDFNTDTQLEATCTIEYAPQGSTDWTTVAPNTAGNYTARATVRINSTNYYLTKNFRVIEGHYITNNNTHQLSVNKTGAMAGESITVTFTPQIGESVATLTVTGGNTNLSIGHGITDNGDNTYTFAMPNENVTLGGTFTFPMNPDNFAQDGDTYTIKNADGWDYFCQRMKYDANLDGFRGKTVELAVNISVTTMAGTVHPFKGTFDGKGNTLDFNPTEVGMYSAPFQNTNGATICNLHVTGVIVGGTNSYLGGLVGSSEGDLTICDCHVSTQISTKYDSNTLSSNVGIGGIVGYIHYTTYGQKCQITGCVYDGLIYNPEYSGTTYGCGGFVGCLSEYVYVELTDCLFIEGQYDNNGSKRELLWGHDNNMNSTFFHRTNYQGSGKLTNCFFVATHFLKQGSPAVESATAPDNFAHFGTPTDHRFLKVYGHTMVFGGKYYTPIYGDLVEKYDYSGGKSYNIEYDDAPLGIPDITSPLWTEGLRYNRSFTNGKPVTIMLPFNFKRDRITLAGSNENPSGKFYEFKGIEENLDHKWVAVMIEAGETLSNEVVENTLQANHPYLYVPNESTEHWAMYVSGGFSIFTEGNEGGEKETEYYYGDGMPWNHWKFKGTYQPRYWSETEHFEEVGKVYGFAGKTKEVDEQNVVAGDFVRAKSGAKIRPTSCYLEWVEPQTNTARALTRGAAADEELPQSITVKLISASGDITSIGTLDTKTGEVTFDSEAWYTLDGVRLSGKPSTKGIYINNGKKVVIK